MKGMNRHIYLPAAVERDGRREAAMRQFRAFLALHDVCVTKETVEDTMLGDAAGFIVSCHLQAPTIYDVAVRLAKAGWTYTDATEDRVAPCLTGPAGEQVRITRGMSCAKLVFSPAQAETWAGGKAYPDTGS